MAASLQNTDARTYPNTHRYSDSYSNCNGYGNTNSYTESYSDSYSYSYTGLHGHGLSNCNTNRLRDSGRNSDTRGYTYRDANA